MIEYTGFINTRLKHSPFFPNMNTDLYRAKYGLPLDEESHERYIATKTSYRKNKDYRPRFRNYSFGYPVLFVNLDLQKRQLYKTLLQFHGYLEFT